MVLYALEDTQELVKLYIKMGIIFIQIQLFMFIQIQLSTYVPVYNL
jgi:hypothetical protein